MAEMPNFSKMVPGFDFLQSLVKTAGSSMPNMGQWVAPTLNPEELEKRIDELRTVQFWLEQNAKMIGATIQALEVQRMTLSTLKTMNVQMGDLRDSLTIKKPAEAPSAAAEAAPGVQAVDPMQWWAALTKQFTQLAATEMKEGLPQSFDGVKPPEAGAGGPSAGSEGKDAAAESARRRQPATKQTR